MRDPGRIEKVLAAIHEAWLENPDLRLGQLLINAVRPADPCPELYSIEDTKLLRKLKDLVDQMREARGTRSVIPTAPDGGPEE
jgi:hypothetical protein